MSKVCILIRVYNRVEDLYNCISIIRETWDSFDYYIMVISNGKQQGFKINDISKIDNLIELENNAGHLQGNAQLLEEGLPHIPDDCNYTIILEADTWLYSDTLIKKYIAKLEAEKAVWASAYWYSHLHSLAIDFAIINTVFLKQHPGIFKYSGIPERFCANYLRDNNFKYICIKENMPVHLPSYVKNHPFSSGIRFNAFPKSKMVTHHVELIFGGMHTKKRLFNSLAGVQFFKGTDLQPKKVLKLMAAFTISLSYLLPIKGWYMKKKR